MYTLVLAALDTDLSALKEGLTATKADRLHLWLNLHGIIDNFSSIKGKIGVCFGGCESMARWKLWCSQNGDMLAWLPLKSPYFRALARPLIDLVARLQGRAVMMPACCALTF